ncbi:hypothetical protein B5B98_02070 [Staphylococcus delphini]|nr:hypothetical protein B5B98_02070 [Staphylococcus delphini]
MMLAESIKWECPLSLLLFMHDCRMDETPEGTADPENPPTLTTNVTVKSKRWLVEGSAPGNASPRRQSYACDMFLTHSGHALNAQWTHFILHFS